MMGAGKSTIGKQLARRMHRQFLDSDQQIEIKAGVKISVIFEIEGESGFRRRESRVLQDLLQTSNVVMATGGGAILDPHNRKLLSQSGWVIYLHAHPLELFERTRYDAKRPLLQVEDPKNKLLQLFTERDPLYREIADLVIDSSGKSQSSVVTHIEQEILRITTSLCNP